MEHYYAWRDCNGKKKSHMMLMKEPLCVSACGFYYAPVLVLETANRERCKECDRVADKIGLNNRDYM